MKPILAISAAAFLLLGTIAIRMAMKGAPQGDGEHPNGISTLAGHGDLAQVTADPGEVPASEERLTNFQMTDQSGKSFDSTSLQGKIWIGSIFFSSCPSTCRVQNERVMELQQKFASRGVEFVSITCDPEHDTPAVLADYSRIFGADKEKWHFLTADAKLIRRVGNEIFGITVQGLTHSDRLVLFDRGGTIVGTYRSTDRDEVTKLAVKVEELLNTPAQEAAPPPELTEPTEAAETT
jgi:protein SCO1